MLSAAGQFKSIIRGNDLAVVFLDNSEQTIVLADSWLGESLGQHLIAQHPGDISRWSSIPRDARRTEVSVGLVRSLNGRLGDQLHLWTLGCVSHQQIHRSGMFLRLDAQEAGHWSIVHGLNPGDLNTALALLEALSKVLELVMGERGTEDDRILAVQNESTVLDWTGRSAKNPHGFTLLLNIG